MDIIGGFLDNEDFKSYVLRLVQSFYDENNESFKQWFTSPIFLKNWQYLKPLYGINTINFINTFILGR